MITGKVFNSSRTWNLIRVKKDRVHWSKVVWFAQGVPRQAFITWLAMKDRLSTGRRMRQWGVEQGCELCGERDETREHLFFACPYSYTVWEALAKGLLGRGINPDWDWTVQHLSDYHLSYMEREEWKETSKPKNNCRANEEKSRKGCEDKDCVFEVYS
ncbi:uncharacterized protein LOC130500145 [Raphanus sativus]|uniref:Uncharacterized protein LOC130500145 n=1 Tax=Raphanus sativus TaxID=3726 RepID=A0A9W3CGZ1_RAPSA|nr:uncharacterized protein LOC130500145 [Raphanus sativus]